MRISGLAAIAVVVCSVAWAQDGSPVNQSDGPPHKGWTLKTFYTGTLVDYACSTEAVQPAYVFKRADSTITNIIDAANVASVTAPAHGLSVGNAVTVAGATVDSDLNGTYYVLTIVSADEFTFTSASVSDATYTEATLTITTTAPRTSASIWSIQKFSYDGSNNMVLKQWANGTPGSRNICDNRATTTGATKVTYQ